MWSAIIGWILNSQGAKTAGAAVAGSGITVAALLSMVAQNIDAKADQTRREVILYVDSRHDQIALKIENISKNQSEIKLLIQKIDDRLYELNRQIKK